MQSNAQYSLTAPVKVPNSQVRLARLGFGCVRLSACVSEKHALATLSSAFDLGVNHFDVARLYGAGTAEGILGRFAKSRRSQLTISTKVGLLPPARLAGKAKLIGVVKKLLRPFPGIMKLARRGVAAAGGPLEFNAAGIEQSLETSLRELQTDYVDCLFLHEASIADCNREDVIAFLDRQLRRGTIKTAGIGSASMRFRQPGTLPELYQVLQFDHSAAQPSTELLNSQPNRLCIVHSVFAPLAKLMAIAEVNPRLLQETSARLELDLSDPAIIRSLLLHEALQANSHGCVLFSSTSEEHIRETIQDAAVAKFSPIGLREFSRYAQRAAMEISRSEP